jgi:hypothetical protein
MATLEQVEKLRERANVSYDEAKAALDATSGDLLEAMIYLENLGKVRTPTGGGYYNSEKGGSDEKSANNTNNTNNASNANNAGYSGYRKGNTAGETFGDIVKKFFRFCAKVIQKGNINTFEVLKGDECKASFPLTVLALLLIFAFWITIPLIIIGLFFGLRYRFCGPDFGKNTANNVMNSAADAAETIKKSFKENHN